MLTFHLKGTISSFFSTSFQRILTSVWQEQSSERKATVRKQIVSRDRTTSLAVASCFELSALRKSADSCQTTPEELTGLRSRPPACWVGKPNHFERSHFSTIG